MSKFKVEIDFTSVELRDKANKMLLLADVLDGKFDSDQVSENSAPEIDIDQKKTVEPVPLETSSPEPANVGTDTVEVDKDGVPWDERIHSSSKGQTAKGIWKKRKNLPEGLYERITAELKGGPVAVETPPPAPVVEDTPPPAPAATTPPPAPAATTPPPAPSAPAEPVRYIVEGEAWTADELKASGWDDAAIAELRVADPAPTPATNTEMTFPELMQKVTAAVAAGTLTDEQVKTAAINQGLSSLALAAASPVAIPGIHAELFGE